MAGKSNDDSKVMDVSKPGKGKIVTTSRPVVVPVVDKSAASNDISVSTGMPDAEQPALAPSASRKVIQPIESPSEPAEKPSATAETVEAVPEEAAEPEPATASESTDSLPAPKPDEASPAAPEAPATDVSGAASVDEMAKAAEAKRLAAEQAKAEAQQDQKVEELTASKTYFVPIKGAGKNGSKRPVIALLAVVLIAAVYLLLDAGALGGNVKLPYEFFKDQEPARATDSSQEAGGGTSADGASATSPSEKPPETTDGDAPVSDITPEDRALNEEAKQELMNLQVKLETYFNDNGVYPQSLTDLEPMPTADELQDAGGQSYAYITDGDTYVLSATLSDGSEYELQSVNTAN